MPTGVYHRTKMSPEERRLRRRDRAREWREANREHVRISQKARYAATPEEKKERQRERARKYYADNKEKWLPKTAKQKEWRKVRYDANPEKYREATRVNRHGGTDALYDRMLLEQSGKCGWPGCNVTPQTQRYGRLFFDHCHKSGRLRKLLCNFHNVAYGMAGDSREGLEKFYCEAIQYQEQADAKSALEYVQAACA